MTNETPENLDPDTGKTAHVARPVSAGTKLPDHIVTVGWSTERTPAKPPKQNDIDEDVAAIWPAIPKAAKALRPNPGSIKSSQPVLVVTLFGVDGERIAQAVRRIERQQRASRSFTPLFLTDSLDTAPIRQAGFTFEYLIPAVFCGPSQAAKFEARFQMLWQKWKGASLIDFSARGFLAARIENLDFYFQREDPIENQYDPRKPRPTLPQETPTDIAALRAEYRSTGMDKLDDNFVLYRIIGNDLPPRHEVGQTLRNLTFLLENEPALPKCEKRWVVNRIVNPEQESAVIALLEKHDQPYLHIPFDLDEYGRIGWDLESYPDDAFFLSGRYHQMTPYEQQRAQAHSRRLKNNYVIHNNGARNAALRDGRDRAKWVLPWDGNCFVTPSAWEEITQSVTGKPYLKYFTVPMARLLDNADLLDPTFRPEAEEEPQVIFRQDSTEEFDETYYYGRRPKVEFFYRLGITGKWDGWRDDAWDRPRADRSSDAGTTGEAGWVARLFSGQSELEVDKSNAAPTGLVGRGHARIEAISNMLDGLDIKSAQKTYRPDALTAYDDAKVAALAQADPGTSEAKCFARLVHEADLALQRGPYTVTDKTVLPPSGDAHDYYNPAPYWWPNPATPNGMPYQFRDGLRISGTRLYEIESDAYDRTRLQKLFDDTTTLSLAWLATGHDAYIDHAASFVKTWFLNPETRMNPHLLYSQIRNQTPHDHGSKSGVIEMKDLYYFLDAVRIIERAGGLNDEEKDALREWLKAYLEWLQTSEQGMAERLTSNNHGTLYDLQTGTIAAFLGDVELLQAIFRTSRERILEQFKPDGQQPHEMKRTQTAHYCCFNLQSWINLANLAEACGDSLWTFEAENGRGLAQAFNWLLPRLAQPTWKFEQIEPFDRSRFLPLFFAARDSAPSTSNLRLADSSQAKPLFNPHDGIMPFWMLTRPAPSTGHSDGWHDLSKRLQKLEAAASELMGYSITQSDGDVDIPNLDKKLWGGFSDTALQSLQSICEDPSSDQQTINRASRILARWFFSKRDYAQALATAQAMQGLNIKDERERLLLAGYCHDRLGDPTAAKSAFDQVRTAFPKDANLALAAANLSATDNENPSASFDATLARIYKNAGLPPLNPDTEDGGRSTRGAQTLSADAPLVTVILPVTSGATHLRGAIASLLSQTWTNLEILATVSSKDRKNLSVLNDLAAQIPRVKVIKVPAKTPDHEARNIALRAANGVCVTVHCADETSHPWRIAEQVQPILNQSAVATVSQHIKISADHRVDAGWSPDFKLIFENPTSLMVSTDMLRDAGGWDASSSEPDAYLAWRLKKVVAKNDIQTVMPQVPASLSWIDEDTAPGPTHLMFPYGQRRDGLRRLVRLAAIAPPLEATDEIQIPAPLTAMDRPDRVDVVFVGDFSEGATAIEAIQEHVKTRAQSSDSVAIFHWPNYHDSWNARLSDDLADLIEEGAIHQVSGFDKMTASEVVLCNPYVLHHHVDGLPDFENDKLIVLGGPELTTAEFYEDRAQQLLMRDEISQMFSQSVILRSL